MPFPSPQGSHDPYPYGNLSDPDAQRRGFCPRDAAFALSGRPGVSHLYLSPIFLAGSGSTHGYDIINPTRIDPVLGGREGFDALARAAGEQGLGIILDIVPNHTAFTLENPWLLDVLKHGPASRYARHFDIDWDAGPLVLPFLPEPFEKMLDDGAFHAADGMWHFGDVSLPLAEDSPVTGDLRALHDTQHWRLVHFELERDGITHRRFFNVTSLIRDAGRGSRGL